MEIYNAGDKVAIYLKTERENHTYEHVPHAGFVVSSTEKTVTVALAEGGREYRRERRLVHRL